jgi:hypothetical protein
VLAGYIPQRGRRIPGSDSRTTLGLWIVRGYAAISVKGTVRAMTPGSVTGGWAWKHHPSGRARRSPKSLDERCWPHRQPGRYRQSGTSSAAHTPDRSQVFQRRAGRFDRLAAGSAIANFLSFMAAIVAAQSAALASLPAPVAPRNFLVTGRYPSIVGTGGRTRLGGTA